MNPVIEEIVKDIDAKIAALQDARRAILNGAAVSELTADAPATVVRSKAVKAPQRMSPEARRKIGEASRKRWEERRKAAVDKVTKKATKKAANPA